MLIIILVVCTSSVGHNFVGETERYFLQQMLHIAYLQFAQKGSVKLTARGQITNILQAAFGTKVFCAAFLYLHLYLHIFVEMKLAKKLLINFW